MFGIIFVMTSVSANALNEAWGNSASQKQAAFLKTLRDYDIINPAIIDDRGNHVTRDLREIHSPRRFRRELSPHVDDLPSKLYMAVNVSRTESLHLNLTHHQDFLSKGFVIETRRSNLSESELKRPEKRHRCHYKGHVFGDTSTKVALSACDGLRGMIWAINEEYFIEPVVDHVTRHAHPHVIYKRSSLPAGVEPPVYRAADRMMEHDEATVRPLTENVCGVTAQADDYQTKRRSRRSVSRERFVETLVVVDYNMYKYYHDQDVETYALTIMNMVTALYHDASLGNLVNIVLVRLMIMAEEEESLNITHHADNTLNNFCRWQQDLNDPLDSNPSHHDTALLFTRKDICLGINKPCATLGLAHVSAICESHRSCTINEDSGLGMAYTVAHELGHLFGMNHDDARYNDCEIPEPGTSYLMAGQLNGHRGPMKWSRCSRDYISRFLDQGLGDCLLDEPAPHKFNFPHLPAGVMYSADYQCKLLFKRNATLCTQSNVQMTMCSTLWCQVDRFCNSKTIPAAPGTACGENKWCYNSKCVNISRPLPPMPGGWGNWGEWSSCSRTCGGGITTQERHCNNPAPANGGKYCEGKRKNYALCNLEPCPVGSVSFRQLQCSRYDDLAFYNHKFTWIPHIEEGKECRLYCKPLRYLFGSVEKAPMVEDGTPCGENTNNVCINGICYKVGCDHRINSNAVEDICGVCHGDGSSCKQISNEFNNTVIRQGPIRITVIPVGARSISVEEKLDSANYIDLQDTHGRSIFNSLSVPNNGEYTVDNQIHSVIYNRQGSMEKITVKGPLEEPLNVVCDIKTLRPSIGYQYYLPKSENETYTRPTLFRWQHDEWTPCSTTCGNGTQRAVVRCVGLMEGFVDDSYCNGSKPEDMERSCNEHKCPASWWIGPWQTCSVTCGQGERMRSVFCIRSLSSDEQTVISDEECSQHGAEDKPPTTATCSHFACPSKADWRVGVWSECSASCGEGIQVRTIECAREDKLCSSDHRPQTERDCVSPCHYGFFSSIEDINLHQFNSEYDKSSILSSLEYSYDSLVSTFGGWEGRKEKQEAKQKKKHKSREDITIFNILTDGTAGQEWPIDSGNTLNEDSINNDDERDWITDTEIARRENYIALHGSNSLPLIEWKSEAWSQCSVTCGPGIRSRVVSCVITGTSTTAYGCSPNTRPTGSEVCQDATCPEQTESICEDTLDLVMCLITKKTGSCSSPAFRKVCCATCAGAR